MAGCTKVCEHFQGYFVAGLGGTSCSTSSKKDLKSLVETAFGLQFTYDKLQFLPNKSTMTDSDMDLHKEIMELARAHGTHQCTSISLIFLTHSDGARAVYDAYEALSKERGFERIRDLTAIFSIGGTRYIKKSHAKITENVHFKNDDMAKTVAQRDNTMYANENCYEVGPIKKYSCLCCSDAVQTRPTRPTEKPTKAVKTRGIAEFSKATSANISDQSLQLARAKVQQSLNLIESVASCVVEWHLKSGSHHYMEEYMVCRNFRLRIKRMLGFNDDPLRCMCTNSQL